MGELKVEIVEHLGVIKEKKGGWNKELNLVSWNGASPKYDVRDWSEDHQKMSKGATFTEEELIGLHKLVDELFFQNSERDSWSDDIDCSTNLGQESSIISPETDYTEKNSPAESNSFLEEISRLEKEL